MGLDMYLYRIEKVEGYSFDELIQFGKDLHTDESKLPGAVSQIIKERFAYGHTFRSLSEDIGYWRKANQIHNWFVENVQSGVDDCEAYIVTKEQLNDLLSTVVKVLALGENTARELLPVRGGFFFGSTEFDEYYYEDLESTKEILEKVLERCDFDKEYIYYESSW